MRTRVLSVLIHSCNLEPWVPVPENELKVGVKYVRDSEDPPAEELSPVPIGEGYEYYPLPGKCNCRKLAIYTEAKDIKDVGGGKIVWTLNIHEQRMEIEHKCIWKAQQVKVPRIDLISTADIERAFLPKAKLKNLMLRFNPKPSDKDIEEAYGADNPHARKQYQHYIDEIHELYMRNRRELIREVPADWVDPSEGRLLFPFPTDDRTKGGH
jgi:hypothetical protein